MPQLSLDLEQPLDYQLLVSARAKRLSLRVEPGRGLIVTVPRRFPRREIPAFVESNRRWIEEALSDIDSKTPQHYKLWPPRELQLQALGTRLQLTYSNLESCVKGAGGLALRADPGDRVAVATEISLHLRALAQRVLPPLLATLSQANGLVYRRVCVRGQRTVWGSYSSSGTLSLNYKLLFLRRELVHYVLLHELAHTRYLDHSPAFWRLLETLHPEARALDSNLRCAGHDVPPWLELAR